MELSKRKVTRHLPEHEEVKQLLIEAFPDENLSPFGVLLMMAQRKMVEFWAYYDNNKLIGTTYEIKSDNIEFIIYLAVNKHNRSKGYGTEILKMIKRENPERMIMLSIEPVVPQSLNYAQRIARLKFYERNGFVNTGYSITSDVTEWILAEQKEFNHEELWKMMKEYSHGIYPKRIEPIEKENKEESKNA